MNESLKHHGILGQKWGVRRFQKYPSGYSGDGKFVGKTKEGIQVSNKEYKKNKKALKKDIKTARNLSNFVGGTLYKNDKILAKKYNKATSYKKLNKAKEYEYSIKQRKEVREKINKDLNTLLKIAETDYDMKFDLKKYTPKEDYKEARKAYSRSNLKKDMVGYAVLGAPGFVISEIHTGKKMTELMADYGYTGK